MKVLVTGAKGQLGHDVAEALTARKMDCFGLGKEKLDVTNSRSVFECIESYLPDAVIHCAAYTAVDRAEADALLCEKVNVEGTLNLAKACAENGAKLMYISTDYVFSGTGEKAYRVGDPTDPLSVYGRTKLQGEKVVQSTLERFFILRTSWIYGGNGNNFVRKILSLASSRKEITVVKDQIGSPTYTKDLAILICNMITTEKYGVYHAANEGYCSRADFAREIITLAHLNCRVTSVATIQYPTAAVRPLNSRLDKGSLDANSFPRLPAWDDALERYIHEISL